MPPVGQFSSSPMTFLTRLSAIATLLFASACSADSPLAPTPATTNQPTIPAAPAAIALVSGNDQHGKAGEPLAEPLAVRVTDANGSGLSGVAVLFGIASGAGAFGGSCNPNSPMPVRSSQTDQDGIARMTFLPTVLGRTTVTAHVAGRQDASVTFTVEATVLVIEFWFGYWNVGFVAPCSLSSDVSVSVGSMVEWKIPVTDERYPVTYTVTSMSAPPGAKGFDSGILTSRDRFRFVPSVTGTWEYRDQVTGLTGTLSAR